MRRKELKTLKYQYPQAHIIRSILHVVCKCPLISNKQNAYKKYGCLYVIAYNQFLKLWKLF